VGRRLDIEQLRPWIEVCFDRASGPGGQNVNKVATRTTLLFDFHGCPALSSADVRRIRQRLATRLARDGRLRVVSQVARTQIANRLLAEQRLIELLLTATSVPKPRRPTRPTAAARERRLKAKHLRSDLKRLRQKKPNTND
jgi:ribosome-associated protein